MGANEFLWRATAAILRRSGTALSKASYQAYSRSRPKITAAERELLAPNAHYRNLHAGQRCFVIGNGPSIKNQDLSPLANELTFVMNGFWKHEIMRKWQPTYFFFSDQVLFDRSVPSKEFFVTLRERTNSSTFFAPLSQREVIVQEDLLPLESTRFFYSFETLDQVQGVKNFDFTQPVPAVLSVGQLGVVAAMAMGCSPIYLMGFDYDWLSHHGDGAFYFFPGVTLNNHPDAAGKLHAYDLEMESMIKVWKGFRKMSEVAENNAIKIYNATHGGFLDVFERVSYESLFNSVQNRA